MGNGRRLAPGKPGDNAAWMPAGKRQDWDPVTSSVGIAQQLTTLVEQGAWDVGGRLGVIRGYVCRSGLDEGARMIRPVGRADAAR